MADYNSGLPIRSEADGTDERVHTKICDGATPSQMASVDTDLNLHVEMHGNDPTAADKVLLLSELGSANIDGLYDVANNTNPSNIGLMGHVRAASPADTDQTERLTAIANGSVHALDVSIHDEAGAAYSDSNPLPVYIAADPGTEVHNYDIQVNLAAAGTDNHNYAVPANSFELHKVWASASGKLKIEILWSSDNVTYTPIAIGYNSTANPNIDLDFRIPYTLAGSATSFIRVIRTNKDNQQMDVQSTIIGLIK